MQWWVGQNDQSGEKQFRNLDDSDICPGVFLDWQADQPNGGDVGQSDQDCIVFQSGNAGTFQDKDCSATYGTLCKTAFKSETVFVFFSIYLKYSLQLHPSQTLGVD